MGTRDARVDGYIARAAPFAQPILRHLRRAVHAGCPDVEETMKWSFPHFTYTGLLCSMAAFKEHCAFAFWKGSLLGLGGTRGEEAMGQFGRITSLADLPGEKQLIRLIQQAAALNESGAKVNRRQAPTPRAPLTLPSDLRAALAASPRARAVFNGFSPSHKREYVEWILEARREETRKRRIASAVAWIAEGKGRNWKYERHHR